MLVHGFCVFLITVIKEPTKKSKQATLMDLYTNKMEFYNPKHKRFPD